MVSAPESTPPGPALDVRRIRADFPILQQRVHGDRPLIYLDNAATSQKPQVVIDALTAYYTQYNANVHRALHYMGERATAAYEAVRGRVARFIGAPEDGDVVFTRGTTESINLVARTWGHDQIQAGDTVIATAMEHHSNLVPWQMCCHARGATLKLVPVQEDGTLDLAAYADLLDERTRLVAITHVSNVLGTVNPVREIVRQAHAVGARVLVDAAQSVPYMPVNVAELEADFFVFSGHKCGGPTGVGVCWARRELWERMPPFMGGGEMIERVHDDHATWADVPYKFEAGTPNIAGVIALGVALEYLEGLGMDRIHAYEQELTAYTVNALSHLSGVRVFGQAPKRGGAVSFDVAGLHPHDLSQYVDQQGIAIRAGHLCAQPLMRRLGVPAVSRASLAYYNTTDEIDALVAAIGKAQQFFGNG